MDKYIETVKQMIADGQVAQDVAEKYFTELKESEDERICRQLIAFLKQCKAVYGDVFNQFGIDIDEALAWLEKQGEQKPNYCHHEVDLTNCSDEYRKAFYDGWNNCNQQHEQLKAEQKPVEWSEEDENMRQETIDWLEQKCFPYALENENPARESIYWLKSLRPQKQWKPSEDMIKALADALSLAKNCGDEGASDLRELLEQLKKL